MKVIKEQKCMDMLNVRDLCINQGYCTCCDNDEYYELLVMCQGEVDNEKILIIAEKIFEYSDVNAKMNEFGCDEEEVLCNICFGLVNECCYSLVEIVENEDA